MKIYTYIALIASQFTGRCYELKVTDSELENLKGHKFLQLLNYSEVKERTK